MRLRMKFILNQFMRLWEKGAFHIFIGSFLSKFVAFFGSIFLVRVLSKTSYGLLGYMENIYGYVYIFAGMGLGNALLRYVILGKTLEDKYKYYRYTIFKGSRINVLLVLIVIVCSLFYPHPDEFESAKWLLILMLFTMPFQFLVECNSLTLRAMLDNKRYATTAFITSTMLVISRYIGAILFDLNGVIFAKIIVNIIFGISLCFLLYQLYFRECKSTCNLQEEEKKLVNKYSVQYMITNGIWAIFMLNDVFLLSRMGGSAAIIADYKVAYVLPGNLSIISTAIGIFIGPYFVQHESDYDWVWKNFKRNIIMNSSLIALIALFMFVFAKPIIIVLYGIQYENVVPVMRLLLIAAFANCGLRYPSAHLLSSMGQIKYNMIISFMGMALQVCINIFMIPKYGGVGAALTSIGVYFFMAIALLVVFIKKYRITQI